MTKRTKYNPIYLFGFIGFLLGYTLCVIEKFHPRIDLYCYAIFSSLLFTLAYKSQHRLRLTLTSLLVPLFICSPLFFYSHTMEELFFYISKWFIFSYSIMVFITMCFHTACHNDNHLNPSYQRLFNAAWDIPLFFCMALFFCVLGGGFIVACLYLLVQTPLPWSIDGLFLFRFTIIIISTSFFIGLAIAIQQKNILENIRSLVVQMVSFLFPYLMVISTIYVLFLIFVWLLHFFPQMYVSNSQSVSFYALSNRIEPAIYVLLFWGILTFNTLFQIDGIVQEKSKFIFYGLKFYTILLLILSIQLLKPFLIHTSYDFIIQNQFLFDLCAFFYCLVYAIAAFLPAETGKQLIINSNVAISLCFVFGVVLFNDIQTPQTNVYYPKITAVLRPLNLTNNEKKPSFNQIDEDQKRVFEKHGIKWDSTINKSTYFVINNGSKLGICRTKYQSGYQAGAYKDGLCTITYAGRAIHQSSFELLSNATNKVEWVLFKSTLSNDGIGLGLEYITPDFSSAVRPLFACMVEISGTVILGKVVDNICNVNINGEEISFSDYNLLRLKTELTK